MDDHRKYPLHAAEPPLKWIITENIRWGGSPPAAAAYPLGPPLGRRRISGSSQKTPAACRRWATDAEVDDHREHSLHAAEPPPKWMITENTRCMPPLRDHREHSLLATRCMTPLGDQTRCVAAANQTRCVAAGRSDSLRAAVETLAARRLGDQTRCMPLLKHSLHAGVP